jgi:hypothetical protein
MYINAQTPNEWKKSITVPTVEKVSTIFNDKGFTVNVVGNVR